MGRYQMTPIERSRPGVFLCPARRAYERRLCAAQRGCRIDICIFQRLRDHRGVRETRERAVRTGNHYDACAAFAGGPRDLDQRAGRAGVRDGHDRIAGIEHGGRNELLVRILTRDARHAEERKLLPCPVPQAG